jgi:hypothetical protein
MAKGLDTLYKNQSLLYKYLLYVLAVGLVVYFFPKGGKFKYEFQKGKPWQHETLYAPFDFSVKKTSEELSAEKAAIQREHIPYFSLNDSLLLQSKEDLTSALVDLKKSNPTFKDTAQIRRVLFRVLDSVYARGLLARNATENLGERIYLLKENTASIRPVNSFMVIPELLPFIQSKIQTPLFQSQATFAEALLLDVVVPNVVFNKDLQRNRFQRL